MTRTPSTGATPQNHVSTEWGQVPSETIATVRELGGGATIEAFQDAAGIAKTAASDRLLKAHKAGALTRTGTGKKGDTYHYDVVDGTP